MKMVSIATKIMWHVSFNIVNQHTKVGDIQTNIEEIINTHIFPTKIALTDMCIKPWLMSQCNVPLTMKPVYCTSGHM